jgi:hypothetical protein
LRLLSHTKMLKIVLEAYLKIWLLGKRIVHSELKIEAVGYSESLAPLCRISEVSNIHTRRSGNLKSDMARPLPVYYTQGRTAMYPRQRNRCAVTGSLCVNHALPQTTTRLFFGIPKRITN